MVRSWQHIRRRNAAYRIWRQRTSLWREPHVRDNANWVGIKGLATFDGQASLHYYSSDVAAMSASDTLVTVWRSSEGPTYPPLHKSMQPAQKAKVLEAQRSAMKQWLILSGAPDRAAQCKDNVDRLRRAVECRKRQLTAANDPYHHMLQLMKRREQRHERMLQSLQQPVRSLGSARAELMSAFVHHQETSLLHGMLHHLRMNAVAWPSITVDAVTYALLELCLISTNSRAQLQSREDYTGLSAYNIAVDMPSIPTLTDMEVSTENARQLQIATDAVHEEEQRGDASGSESEDLADDELDDAISLEHTEGQEHTDGMADGEAWVTAEHAWCGDTMAGLVAAEEAAHGGRARDAAGEEIEEQATPDECMSSPASRHGDQEAPSTDASPHELAKLYYTRSMRAAPPELLEWAQSAMAGLPPVWQMQTPLVGGDAWHDHLGEPPTLPGGVALQWEALLTVPSLVTWHIHQLVDAINATHDLDVAHPLPCNLHPPLSTDEATLRAKEQYALVAPNEFALEVAAAVKSPLFVKNRAMYDAPLTAADRQELDAKFDALREALPPDKMAELLAETKWKLPAGNVFGCEHEASMGFEIPIDVARKLTSLCEASIKPLFNATFRSMLSGAYAKYVEDDSWRYNSLTKGTKGYTDSMESGHVNSPTNDSLRLCARSGGQHGLSWPELHVGASVRITFARQQSCRRKARSLRPPCVSATSDTQHARGGDQRGMSTGGPHACNCMQNVAASGWQVSSAFFDEAPYVLKPFLEYIGESWAIYCAACPDHKLDQMLPEDIFVRALPMCHFRWRYHWRVPMAACTLFMHAITSVRA